MDEENDEEDLFCEMFSKKEAQDVNGNNFYHNIVCFFKV